MPDKLRKVLIAVCCAVLFASLGYIGYYILGSMQVRALERRQQEWVAALPPLPTPIPARGTYEEPAPPANEYGPDGPTATDAPGETPAPTPRPDYRSRFQSILDINPNFYGLLSIPGLRGIENSFVVQGSDNEFYLNHTFEHQRNARGTLFLDFQARPWFASCNYVIYGHNMADGSMFSDLIRYEHIQTYLDAPIIHFDTIYGPTTWLIFAAYTTEPDFHYFHTHFAPADFISLLEEIHRRSVFHTGVDVQPTDTLLTLSTCSHMFLDMRFTVQARLLRPGECIENFYPTVEANPRPQRAVVRNVLNLSQMPIREAAFAQFEPMSRYYFLLPTDSGIEWYSTTMLRTVQGPFPAWERALDPAHFSWLAAGVALPPGGLRNSFIVSGGIVADVPGLFVLSRRQSPNGLFTLGSNSPITPSGVDARWPLLHTNPNQGMTVFYTVDSGNNRVFYAIPIEGGTPVYIYTTGTSEDARPVGAVNTEEGTLLFIQEFATGDLRLLFLCHDGQTLPGGVIREGLRGRFTVYYHLRRNQLRYFYESRNGMVSGTLDPGLIPPWPTA